MKGVILAGGTGSRLAPLTDVTNKHLLPVWKMPMIYYPLGTLINAGIRDIMIVSGPDHAGHFLKLLGSGRKFKVKFNYEIQDKALGIANALSLAEDFFKDDKCIAILGDNVFEDNIKNEVKDFKKTKEGAKIFLKKVPDPERFGVPIIDGDRIKFVQEKPKKPKSPYAVTGIYMYDNEVFDVIKKLTKSDRGEYEITDVQNYYINKGNLRYSILNGFWSDSGTFKSLFRASEFVKNNEEKFTFYE